ncbi:hypothetical protein [Amycolatopsis jejuensis]|nr:hypothetical protein [Amycolatopsis jejuensis]
MAKCERCRERQKRIEQLQMELTDLQRLVDECEAATAAEVCE